MTAELTFSPSELSYLREKNRELTDQEFAVFLSSAMRYGLNPLQNQIHAVVRTMGRNKSMTVQTGIDGYRLIADRTGAYAGSDDATFEGNLNSDSDMPAVAHVTVYKMVEGQRCPFSASARMSEYMPKSGAFMWQRMPHVMLAKCAEALALRKAFPAALSGLYTKEEMAQADPEEDGSIAAQMAETKPPQQPPQQAEPSELKYVPVLESESAFIPYPEGNKRADALVRAIRANSDLNQFEAQMAASHLLIELGVNPSQLNDDGTWKSVCDKSRGRSAGDWRSLATGKVMA